MQRRLQLVPWAWGPRAGLLLPSPPPENGSVPSRRGPGIRVQTSRTAAGDASLCSRGAAAAHLDVSGQLAPSCAVPGGWEVTPNSRMLSARCPGGRVTHSARAPTPRSSRPTALLLTSGFTLLPLLVLCLQPSSTLPTSFHPANLFFLETALRGGLRVKTPATASRVAPSILFEWPAVLRVRLSPRPHLRPFSAGNAPREAVPTRE